MPGRPLWAPWRMEYIAGPKSERCIFCDSGLPPSERLLLHEGDGVRVMLNRFPYAPGHVMVAPERHVARLYDLDDATRDGLWARVGQASRILDDLLGCDGQNVGLNLGGAAGAGFADHLHVHVVPRWSGDHNFMTVVGELRVMSEHLERTYEKLRPRFEALV